MTVTFPDRLDPFDDSFEPVERSGSDFIINGRAYIPLVKAALEGKDRSIVDGVIRLIIEYVAENPVPLFLFTPHDYINYFWASDIYKDSCSDQLMPILASRGFPRELSDIVASFIKEGSPFPFPSPELAPDRIERAYQAGTDAFLMESFRGQKRVERGVMVYLASLFRNPGSVTAFFALPPIQAAGITLGNGTDLSDRMVQLEPNGVWFYLDGVKDVRPMSQQEGEEQVARGLEVVELGDSRTSAVVCIVLQLLKQGPSTSAGQQAWKPRAASLLNVQRKAAPQEGWSITCGSGTPCKRMGDPSARQLDYRTYCATFIPF